MFTTQLGERKKVIVDNSSRESKKGGLFVQSRMVRGKGCNQNWSASKVRHTEPERSFSLGEAVGAAAKRPRRKSRWMAILRSAPAKRYSLRLVPLRAATPPLIRRDSEIAPLWGSVGGVHLVARRRAPVTARPVTRGSGDCGTQRNANAHHGVSGGPWCKRRRRHRWATRSYKVALCRSKWARFANRPLFFSLTVNREYYPFIHRSTSPKSGIFLQIWCVISVCGGAAASKWLWKTNRSYLVVQGFTLPSPCGGWDGLQQTPETGV